MTKSQSYKYSELFGLLSDPESLMLMVLLEENGDAMTAEELSKKVKTSVSEVERHLYDFESNGIVTDENREGETYYKFGTSKNGSFMRNIINRALEMYI